jgi:hypothetical protein
MNELWGFTRHDVTSRFQQNVTLMIAMKYVAINANFIRASSLKLLEKHALEQEHFHQSFFDKDLRLSGLICPPVG